MKADRPAGGKVWADDGINILPLGTTCMWFLRYIEGNSSLPCFSKASKSGLVNTRGSAL